MTKYKHSMEFEKIGTLINVEVIVLGEKKLSKIKSETENIVGIYQRMENIFSRFNKNSELSKLNQELGKFHLVSKELRRMAKKYLEYYELSYGEFDPRVIYVLENTGYDKDISEISRKRIKTYKNNFKQSIFKRKLKQDIIIKKKYIKFFHKMDFSGVVKGRINDLVGKYLKSKGFKNFKINSGGDLFLGGLNSNNSKWRINVEGVREEELVFNLSNEAISTSAEDRRNWTYNGKKVTHLIKKSNPEKKKEIKKVSVIAKNSEEADFFSTYLFLKGLLGYNIAKEKKVAAMFVDQNRGIKMTQQIKNYL